MNLRDVKNKIWSGGITKMFVLKLSCYIQILLDEEYVFLYLQYAPLA